MFTPADLFDLRHTAHASLFDGCANAWDALTRLPAYVQAQARPRLENRCLGVAWIGDLVCIGEGTVVEDGAMIQGPAIIGRHCQIRHNAYIRHQVLVGDHCVIGNACEIKHAILFDGCEVPHHNYIGDSILGHQAHLGAGAKISNLKLTPGTVRISHGGVVADTGLLKLGALIGDGAQIGCNAVLNPGTVLGRGSIVYPNVSWRGVLPAGHIARNRAAVEVGRLEDRRD